MSDEECGVDFTLLDEGENLGTVAAVYAAGFEG